MRPTGEISGRVVRQGRRIGPVIPDLSAFVVAGWPSIEGKAGAAARASADSVVWGFRME